jgi:hypothetical protein
MNLQAIQILSDRNSKKEDVEDVLARQKDEHFTQDYLEKKRNKLLFGINWFN